MSKHRGAGVPMLTFFILLAVLFIGMLLFGGCDSSYPEFYSIEKDCLIVKHETEKGTIYKCYKTHEAYAIHEGLHLDHAKERFNGFKREAMKLKEMNSRIADSNTFTRPQPKRENYFKKQIDSIHAAKESSRE